MAATYTIGNITTTLAPNKSLLSIYNGVNSSRVIRVYRIWALNNQLTSVIGVLTTLEIRRITNSLGGVDIVPTKHFSNNETPGALLRFTTAASDTVEALFRRILWSADEPSNLSGTTIATIDELETFVPLNCLWDAGYSDSNVDPIILREGYGVTLKHSGSSVVGTLDVFMEFTIGTT